MSNHFRVLVIILLSLTLLTCTPKAQHMLTTVAGKGALGYGGDGEVADQAKFNHLRGIALDSRDNLYIADVRNHRVRKVDAITGIITTIAGTGIAGFNGDGGLATQAQLNKPVAVVVDQKANVYIVDMLNYRVRKIDPDGIMTTVVGNGIPGYSGDGGPATQAQINPIYGDITVDQQGNLYLADRDNHRIRQIDTLGIIRTIAGNGSTGNRGDGGAAIQAQLNFPEDMLLDAQGNLYIADTYNHLIRKVDTEGIITTFAGQGSSGLGDGGTAIAAQFDLPIGIAQDSQGNLYIADAEHHRIRKIDTQGYITTIIGIARQGYSPDGVLAQNAHLHFPEDVAVDSADNLYISDKDNYRVRKLIWITPESHQYGRVVLILSSLLLIATGGVLFYLHLYYHPLVTQLSANAAQLLELPLNQLPQAKRVLKRIGRLEPLLATHDIPLIWLDEAIQFINLSNAKRCALLAKRLLATEEFIHHELFLLRLTEAFPLNLTRCLIYFPAPQLPIAEILLQLQQEEMNLQVVIIICFDTEQWQALSPYGHNVTTLWVVPSSRTLTQLLLSPQAIETFAHLLATQLKVTHISPYQTRGGITKETAFFGREKILAHIVNRTPANYLIIGGRQLGKSSLLKQIMRCYQTHPKIHCYYLVLRDHRLQESLLKSLQLPKETPLATVLEHLVALPNGHYRLLLIDEADRFIREEMARGYPLLNQFRSLSETGGCYFIFAGFWDLYQAAVLDYHSPIVNFGEHIIIAALETEACRQLATQPMALLGIHYHSDTLVEHILTVTGQRANLIAIVCQELLTHLAPHQSILTQADVTQALARPAVAEALAGWSQLTPDKQAACLDRIIVYATVEQDKFDLNKLIQLFEQYNYHYTPEQLQQALMRLELAFIIKRTHGHYHYCVPAFQELLKTQGAIKALLKQEMLLALNITQGNRA